MPEDLNPGKEVTGDQTPKTFTQEEVNALMQKRLERSKASFFERYGVKDLNELDDLFEKSKSYDELNQKVSELTTQIETLTNEKNELSTKNEELTANNEDLTNRHKDLTKKYAFQSKNIKPEMMSDIETYFKGKGLEIDENTLDEELKSHKYWEKENKVVPIENQFHDDRNGDDEKELASRIFGVEF